MSTVTVANQEAHVGVRKLTYNCGDFPTHAAAQGCFDWCMQEVGTDVHRLDGDGDGIACESLPLGWRVVGMADVDRD